jgi:hypothetical protein
MKTKNKIGMSLGIIVAVIFSIFSPLLVAVGAGAFSTGLFFLVTNEY